MKMIKTLLILILMSGMQIDAATIREQLNQLNTYWVYHRLTDTSADEQRLFASDAELIQLHLQLVEKTLRAGSAKALNEEQWKQRLHLLDVLHAYWTAGMFPKNTGHTLRTPYFIDLQGTACAVGQLIISSGGAALARQISQENNNGYISELANIYPRIGDWAAEHGFALEELAWIQPCYTIPEIIDLRNPTCHNASNGYFFPDISQIQGQGVLTKSFYKWQNSAWVPWQNMCSQWAFNYLSAGQYKWVIQDTNTVYTFTANLVAPPPATVTLVKSGNFSTCNGTVTASVQGGVQPFSYLWAWNGSGTATPVLTGVCEQSVTLAFYESGSWCGQYIKMEFTPVGTKEEALNKLYIVPNPVKDIMQLQIDPALRPVNCIAKVLNIQGQMVMEVCLDRDFHMIDFHQLPPGLYFLQLDRYKSQRFVKE